MTISSRPTTSGRRPNQRADIQGLRAIAVLAVIANHLFGFPSGGFVGVDVFFVISGFLITGLLLRERDRTGRISFADFYRRRARRIVPAAVLVLVVTVAASWVVFRAGRAISVTVDAFWAVIFGANWRFAIIGTNYLQATGPLSPLQHFWSLGVEEQFYLVWPWLIVLALGVLLRHRAGHLSGSIRTLAVVMAIVVAVSFAFAVWETRTNGTVAYFSTFARAWELGAGGLVAVLQSRLRAIPDRARPFLAWLGIAGLVWSIFFIGPLFAFPGPWAAVPVVATVLILAAGEGGNQRYIWPITNPVSGYVGRVSYSLYLWHFPVIVLIGTVILTRGPRYFAFLIGVTAILSVLSFHFVEDPIRRSQWLEPHRRTEPGTHRSKAAIGVTVVGAACVVVLVCAAVVSGQRSLADTTDLPPVSTAEYSQTQVTAKLEAALSVTAWPRLRPSLDDLPNSIAPEWLDDNCLNVTDANLAQCKYGATAVKHTAVLLGDSVAISWLPGLRKALEPEGWSIQSLTLGECPAVAVSATRYTTDGSPDVEFERQCVQHHDWVINQVKRLHPDLVILSSAESTLIRLTDGAAGDKAVAEWQRGTTQTLNQLTAATGGRVAVIASPPTVQNVQTCATNLNTPEDCAGSPDGLYAPMVKAENAAVSAVNQTTSARVEYVNTLSWFCAPGGRCPPFAGTVPTYEDTTHITAAYSRQLAGLLRRSLLNRTN